MFTFLSGVPPILEFVILLGLAVGTVFTLYKTVYKPIKRHLDKINRGMDTLLGYPPVHDPGSGREIQAATPPLSARVYDLEATNAKMADALEIIAGNQRDLLHLQQEMDERKTIGEQIIAEWTKWRHEVDLAMRDWVSEQDQLGEIVRGELEEK